MAGRMRGSIWCGRADGSGAWRETPPGARRAPRDRAGRGCAAGCRGAGGPPPGTPRTGRHIRGVARWTAADRGCGRPAAGAARPAPPASTARCSAGVAGRGAPAAGRAAGNRAVRRGTRAAGGPRPENGPRRGARFAPAPAAPATTRRPPGRPAAREGDEPSSAAIAQRDQHRLAGPIAAGVLAAGDAGPAQLDGGQDASLAARDLLDGDEGAAGIEAPAQHAAAAYPRRAAPLHLLVARQLDPLAGRPGARAPRSPARPAPTRVESLTGPCRGATTRSTSGQDTVASSDSAPGAGGMASSE